MAPISSPIARHGLIGAFLIAMACGGCRHPDAPAGEAEGAEEEGVKVTVKTSPVVTSPTQETVSGNGRTEALPNQLVTLTPALEGHINEIRASLGDSLHKGDVIVELEAMLAQADLVEKEATRDTLKAALDLLVAEPRPEDRQGLEIAVDQAVATTARAQAALDRLEPLRARKEVSEAQTYEAEQTVVQAKLQHRLAESQLKLLLAGPKREAVEEAKARLAAAEGAVALSRHRLELHTIRSPIDGVLDSLLCHPGQTVAAGASIGEVVDTSRLNLIVWLPTRSAALIHVGQSAQVTSGTQPAAHADASAEEPPAADAKNSDAPAIAAKVASIGHVADPQTGSLPVRVLLDNPEGQIAVGQTLSVSIVTRERADELVVPAAALIDLGEGPLLVVVREGKIAQLHPTSVATHGEWTVIAGTDLQPGERVVVDGGFNLPEETAVETEAAHEESDEK